MILSLLLLASLAAPQQESDYYTVDYLTPPEGEVLEVGGMDFLADGTLLVSTRRGRVWWVDNALAEDPADARFHIFAEGLHEGLGLKVVNDEIYVMQRGELSHLIDLDGDQICDRIEVVSQDWGMSGNYHEFAFGLPMDSDGNFYISTNVGFWSPEWWHGISKVKHRGWVLKVAPDGKTTPFASGVRSPAGLGMDTEGRLYYTDNQGDWMPSCGIFHVQEDDFFGHPASQRWTRKYGYGKRVPSSIEPPDVERTPPAIWLPYEWSRSTGNLVPDTTGGKFGPFDSQMFVAELTNGLVLRTMFEEVQGQVQGAAVLFRQKVGSAFRVQFAPDGTLFTGFTNRGWGGLGPGNGISRMRWTGEVPMEYHDIHLLQDGFELTFTKPLEAVPTAEQVSMMAYDYNWWWDYGSPQMNEHQLQVSGVEVSEDRKSMIVRCKNLEAGWAVRVKVDGAGLLHNEFDYTINQLPEGPLTTKQIAVKVEPPDLKSAGDEGWLTLTWQDPFDAWDADGWNLVDVALDSADPSKFVETPGNGALVNSGGNAADFRSKMDFGDIEFRFNVMLPKGGDSGLFFMDRYELQLNDDPGGCFAVLGGKGPRAQTYRGPGEWHTVTGRFFAPRFNSSGQKTANAKFEQITVDGVMVIGATEVAETTGGAHGGNEAAMGPLRFQGNAGLVALGDVRVRLIADGETTASGIAEKWVPLADAGDSILDYELRGRLTLSDAGSAAIDLRVIDGEAALSLLLDDTGTSEGRTGTIAGYAPLKTQFLQPGVPYQLKVRVVNLAASTNVMVWLNGVLVNEVNTNSVLPPSGIQLRSEIAPGTELVTEDLEVRFLRK
jgi:glucose/arabinose dehydrogenase